MLKMFIEHKAFWKQITKNLQQENKDTYYNT